MDMITELYHNALHSTPAGFVGVGWIFGYMAFIVITATFRIFKGEHMHH